MRKIKSSDSKTDFMPSDYYDLHIENRSENEFERAFKEN